MPKTHKGCNKDQVSIKLLNTVEKTITAYGMFQPDDSVLVGVSGGPDSVALLHLLLILAPRFSISLGVAHLNHCLREKDSEHDAEFVASLAKKLDLPLYIYKEDVREYQHKHKLSLEEAARHVRYAFYNNVAEKNDYNKIALGHHSDDNAELVLMYLFRGSGPLGISGMPPVRDEKIVRPLIKLTRSEIINYLNKNGIKYVSDKTNKDIRHLRNRIRHHLIPLLKKSYNPRIIESLNRLALIMRCEDEWIEDAINHIYQNSVLNLKEDKIVLSVPKLDSIHPAIKRRIIRKAIEKIKGNLRRITYLHINNAITLLQSGPTYGSLDLPDRIRVSRDNDIIIFSKEKNALRRLNVKSIEHEAISFKYKILKPGLIFLKEIGMHLTFSEIGIEDLPDLRRTGHNVAFFDMDSIRFPLNLRNFQPGDRFNPLGMTGTQKVKKYFINKKVQRVKRASCPILLSQEKIIWVVGHRIDDSVKIQPSTSNVLKVELFLA